MAKSFEFVIGKIDKEIAKARKVKGIDAAKLCEIYKKIRPLLVLLMPFLQKIPVWGPKLVSILQFLMKSADAICPKLN
jgi:hypothetical protein